MSGTLDTTAADRLRSDRDALLDALAQAGADVSRPSAIRCPFHDDQHPSAGLYERDGVFRFKCQSCGAGGDVFDIRAKVNGTSEADELRKARAHDAPARRPKQARPAKVFADFDAIRQRVENVVQIDPFRWPDTGAIHALEVRVEPGRDGRSKDIWQMRPVDDGYTWGGKPHAGCTRWASSR